MEDQATFGPNAMLPGTPYVLVRKIGAGAMGDVYEAYHSQRQVTVALKVMATRHLDRADLAERMKTEAMVLSRVKHPNLVAMTDLGLAQDGRVYFAMELLHGHTLRTTIEANAPMRPALAVELTTAILAGLGAAHEVGVVHRDVKPENVFVCSSGDVKLLDFGVAKMEQLASSVTQTGLTIGTPRYMAPEQIEGRAVTFAADLYAAGLVLYELLTNRVPFEEKEPIALAFAHATRTPPSPSSLLPSPLPTALEAAVMRALAKKPEDRFPSAAAFAAELLRATATPLGTGTMRMETVPTSSRDPEPVVPLAVPYRVSAAPDVTPPRASRLPFALAATVALLSAVGAGAFLFVRRAPRPSPGASVSAAMTPTGLAPTPATDSVAAPAPPTVALPSTSASATPSAAALASTSARARAPSHAPASAQSRPGATAAATPSAPVSAAPTVRRPGSGL